MHVHKTKKVKEKSSMSWPNGHRVFKRLVMGLCTFMHPQIHDLYRLQKYLVLTLYGGLQLLPLQISSKAIFGLKV